MMHRTTWPAALVLAAAFALAAGVAPAAAQDWRTVTSMRRASDEDRLRVDIEYGAGELRIQPVDGDLLYRTRLRYDADVFRPRTTYSNGRLRLGIAGENALRFRNHEAGRLELELGKRVPVELNLKFGAVEADIELGGVRVHEARIATGASETVIRFSAPNPDRMRLLDIDVGAASLRVLGLGQASPERVQVEGGMADVTLDFSGPWRHSIDANVKMGLGSVTLRVPRDVGVRVRKTSVLASFSSDGFTKRGDHYFSSNFESAPYHLMVGIESAFGSINIDWIEAATAAAGTEVSR